MDDEQAEDHGEDGAAPDPEAEGSPELAAETEAELAAEAELATEPGLATERNLDEVEPELLATFTEIGIVETRRAIEAILLVATDPTPASLLAQLIEVPVEHVELLCHALADSYEEANHGFQLVKVAGGWRFQTHPDMAPYVERFAMDGQSSKLSNAALETLAIVAYKQPISRAQVSAIRGVNVDAVLRTLVQRGYVDEVGRDTGAGQAVLFGTTSMFLERLGINTVADLPALGDFVPSAEVVEALEQTLKVDLDPDLVTTDPDGDDGPASRPPTPSPDPTGEGATADPAGVDADAAAGDGEPDAEAEAESAEAGQADASPEDEPGPEAEAGPGAEGEAEAPPDGGTVDDADGASEGDVAAEDEAAAEVEPSGEVEVEEEEPDFPREIGDPASTASAAGEPVGTTDFPREIEGPAEGAPVVGVEAIGRAQPARGAGVERASQPARPVNERVAEQAGEPATASSVPVVAPEGVVVDALASPKSGADRTDRPLGPGGEPASGQAGGGQPGLADPAPAPMAGPGAGGAAHRPGDVAGASHGDPGVSAGDPNRPHGEPDRPDERYGDPGGSRPGTGSDDPAGRWLAGDQARPGTGDGPARPDPAAGRVDHEVAAGDGHVVVDAGRQAGGAPAPTPAAGSEPSPHAGPAPAGVGPTVEGRRPDGSPDSPSQPFGHQPERGSDPAANHAALDRSADGADPTTGPGGPGLAGPADPTVPPEAGPGPDLTAAEPVVDLRAPLDLTDPPPSASAPSSSAAGTGPDAARP